MSNPWQIQTVQYDKTNSEGNVDTAGYGQISILLSKYVLKEKGKGLSTNDFTNSYVQKLNSMEIGSQVNKVETLTVNRNQILYPDVDKNININIPTKTSQLENNSGYAKLLTASSFTDYSDSYVGKSKVSFQDEENIAIGKILTLNMVELLLVKIRQLLKHMILISEMNYYTIKSVTYGKEKSQVVYLLMLL